MILDQSMTGDINYSAIQYSNIVKIEFPFRKREIAEILNRLKALKYQADYSAKTGQHYKKDTNGFDQKGSKLALELLSYSSHD